eukprot:Plantae.Rhodophyta-Purpureofilum_apyrenoidigerum.ctg1783.p1 GENE.Plantae.Rhodophyta-Purpureofilum_apyrenoidigerum.ctg1783~~Plantae.Rhodophyta-Purpureofilum_apyrenoidigerum.ctg1783.p1  ORF type:complete len:136 (+),score=21.63 Plantae.Rhodophyta-Purpureofilum_apyrenoidigerum.ctg1783:50-409(+)
MDVLIIALNLRVPREGKNVKLVDKFRSSFEPVYWYQVNPHPNWGGGILFRSFPEDWLLCRIAALRQIRPLLQTKERPTQEQIDEAFRSEAQNKSTGFMDRVASLFSPLLRSNDENREKQ